MITGPAAAAYTDAAGRFLKPRFVAVVGASQGDDGGGRLSHNLHEGGFVNMVHPISPPMPLGEGTCAQSTPA